jgi:hypothetical protein
VSDEITPEENERRFRACLEWIHNLTREELIDEKTNPTKASGVPWTN